MGHIREPIYTKGKKLYENLFMQKIDDAFNWERGLHTLTPNAAPRIIPMACEMSDNINVMDKTKPSRNDSSGWAVIKYVITM